MKGTVRLSRLRRLTLAMLPLYVRALIGSDVQNFQGAGVSQVQALMLDLGAGTMRYAVLSFGGLLGIGAKLFAIPLTAFEFDPADHRACLPA